jgi:hypothetical protein
MSLQSHLPVSSKTSKRSFSRPQWFVLADGQAADRRSDNDSDPTRLEGNAHLEVFSGGYERPGLFPI